MKKCTFTSNPLRDELCGKPAIVAIVRKGIRRTLALRCEEHASNMKDSPLFRAVPVNGESDA